MCPLENCFKEYLYFSSLKKHLAWNHTKLYWEKYAWWSKEEIMKEKEDFEESSEDEEEFVGEEKKIMSSNSDIPNLDHFSSSPSNLDLANGLNRLRDSIN